MLAGDASEFDTWILTAGGAVKKSMPGIWEMSMQLENCDWEGRDCESLGGGQGEGVFWLRGGLKVFESKSTIVLM